MADTNFLQSSLTEDPLQEAALGRPNVHQHYAIHPKHNDSMWKKFAATRDLFYQSHWEILDCLKYAIKGAVFAGTLSSAIWTTHFYDESTITNRKALAWANQQKFGLFKLYWKTNSKFYQLGAFGGAAWYLYWNLLWTGQGKRNDLFTYIGGYSSFLAIGASLFHPRAAYRAGVFGMGLGLLMHFIQTSQMGSDKTSVGFTFEIPNTLSEEQREEQRKKDLIFMLGQCYQVKMQQLKDL